jgi:hypothetical protein
VTAILAGICAKPAGRAGRWVGLGLAVGAVSIIRYPGVLFSLPVGIVLLALHRRDPGALIGRGLLYSAGLLSLVWILPFYVWLQTGHPFASTYTPHWHFDPANPPLWNVLFNPRHGFFWFHPLFLLAVGSLALTVVKGVPSRPARRIFAGAGLAALAAIGTLHGFWFSWWADSYSQRYVTETIPFLAPGLAIFLAGGRRGRRVTLAVALTALSYGFFLLSNAALVYDVMEGGPGQYLSDYAIILDQRMTPGQILDRLAHASFTLPILARHGALVAAGIVAALLGYAALGRVDRRSRALAASSGAEGTP